MAIFGVSLSTSKRTDKELGLVLRGELVEIWLCFDSDPSVAGRRHAELLFGTSTRQAKSQPAPPVLCQSISAKPFVKSVVELDNRSWRVLPT